MSLLEEWSYYEYKIQNLREPLGAASYKSMHW